MLGMACDLPACVRIQKGPAPWWMCCLVIAVNVSACTPQSDVNSCNANGDCSNGRVCADGVCVLVGDAGSSDSVVSVDSQSGLNDANSAIDRDTKTDTEEFIDVRPAPDVRTDSSVNDTAVNAPDLREVIEICNGIDDNGNSQIDEGYTCVQGSSAPCTSACQSQGLKTCDNACNWGPCQPPAETCDGQDNNCDGHIDEIFACMRGSDENCTTSCGSDGVRQCSNTCNWSSCQPPADLCDGSDEDCDGIPDNDADCGVPVYRFLCGTDHAYNNSSTVPPNCIAEGGGPVWYNYADAVDGDTFSTQPLYNLYRVSPADHMLLNGESGLAAATAGGYQLLGDIGHCTTTHVAGYSVPLYRLRNSVNGEHMYTISEYERDLAVTQARYIYEGVQCEVWE